MKRPWFKKRTPKEGIGYSVASPMGVVATVTFILLIVGVLNGFLYAVGRHWLTTDQATYGTLGSITLMVIGFLLLVVAKSDRQSP